MFFVYSLLIRALVFISNTLSHIFLLIFDRFLTHFCPFYHVRFFSSQCFHAAAWAEIRHKGKNSKLIRCLGLWKARAIANPMVILAQILWKLEWVIKDQVAPISVLTGYVECLSKSKVKKMAISWEIFSTLYTVNTSGTYVKFWPLTLYLIPEFPFP